MNISNLIGRLTRDPEVRYTTGEHQMAICKFSLAVDDGYGEKKKTYFIPVTVFGNQAESCERNLGKGQRVAVQGKIVTGSYTNKDGQKVYTTDVVADRVEFIDFKQKDGQNSNQSVPEGFTAMDDSDCPF